MSAQLEKNIALCEQELQRILIVCIQFFCISIAFFILYTSTWGDGFSILCGLFGSAFLFLSACLSYVLVYEYPTLVTKRERLAQLKREESKTV